MDSIEGLGLDSCVSHRQPRTKVETEVCPRCPLLFRAIFLIRHFYRKGYRSTTATDTILWQVTCNSTAELCGRMPP